jgi:hypothetical protein
MTKRLKDEDAKAIDMLLDRETQGSSQNAAGNGGSSHARPLSNPSLAPRMAAAEKILSTLSNMPAPEPAADLVSRTMHLIETRATVPAINAAQSQHRPHA